MKDIFQGFLLALAEKKGSDLHLAVGRPPQMRVNGELIALDHPPLTQEYCARMMSHVLEPAQWERVRQKREVDFSFNLHGIGRCRANVFWERGNLAAAIRLLPTRIPSFAELGLPVNTMMRLCSLPNGLALITGPTGSGKSTTLAAMVDYINETRNAHIISIEDPVEYMHAHKKATIAQRELGSDTESFGEALKNVLREDPDVVVIGEMRDLETMATVLRVAETGHLVLSTLHTSTAANSISRVMDAFPPEQQQQVKMQMSLTLQGVVVQQLLQNVGNTARILATEVMMMTPAIRSLIREHELEQIYSHIQLGGAIGMRTMNSCLAALLKRSLISVDAAFAHSPDEKELRNLMSLAIDLDMVDAPERIAAKGEARKAS